uniref:MADF domain-containing protein n=1 Tax=Wuchereria bancrofti TaxID=6293 RepID=A0A1I8EYW4_WUCBA
MSTIFDDFIDVVKAHPIIYDIRMKESLATVAKCVQQRGHDINGDGCRRRWNKLKFAYARDRTLRRIQGTPPLRSSCAKYFDLLAFLNPFLDDYKAESDDDSTIHSTVLKNESENDNPLNNRLHLLAMKTEESRSLEVKSSK